MNRKFDKPPLLLIKVLKISCSSRFHLLTLLCRQVQRMIFYPPLTCFREKPCSVVSNFLCMQKTINTFYINFLTSYEMSLSCCKYVKFLSISFTVWMSNKVWVKLIMTSFRFIIEILSSQISVDSTEWTPRNWCTVRISYQMFSNTFFPTHWIIYTFLVMSFVPSIVYLTESKY